MPLSKSLSVQPLYEQVRDLLVERISKGVWKPGTSLPNEHDLARELGISTGTVRKALHLLERDRLIMRQRGRGTFVIDQATAEPEIRFSNIRDRGGERMLGDMDLIDQKVDPANDVEQARLELDEGDPVLRTVRLRYYEKRPFMYEQTAIAMRRVPGFDGSGAENYRVSELAQRFGVYLSRATEKVTLAKAPPQIAARLDVSADAPVLELDRVIFAIDQQPVEWRLGYCRLGEGQSYRADMN